MNLFYCLPVELQTYIYSFDSTFKEQFDNVLDEISQQRLFFANSKYFIFDKLKLHAFTMDHLEKPTIICFFHYFDHFMLDQWIQNNRYSELNTRNLHRTFSFESIENHL
jgi:hypothetical protein